MFCLENMFAWVYIINSNCLIQTEWTCLLWLSLYLHILKLSCTYATKQHKVTKYTADIKKDYEETWNDTTLVTCLMCYQSDQTHKHAKELQV